MGTIIAHLGPPKAGSTTIQHWLRDRARELDERGVHPVVVAPDRSSNDLLVRPMERHLEAASNGFVHLYEQRHGRAHPEWHERPVRLLVEHLDEAAARLGTIVFSSENWYRYVSRRDERVLGALETLAAAHDVRVVLYVRPQHELVEAAWRQFGWDRSWVVPSQFVTRFANHAQYLRVWELLGEVAPSVARVVRVFPPSAWSPGNLIEDLARAVLGVEDLVLDRAGADLRANAGMSLRATATLRAMTSRCPPGTTFHTSVRATLKTVIRGRAIADSPLTTSTRALLQTWAHDEFEAGNTRLAQLAGWHQPGLVRAPVARDERPLEALDAIWDWPGTVPVAAGDRRAGTAP